LLSQGRAGRLYLGVGQAVQVRDGVWYPATVHCYA
jgi:hypothetical protein